MKNMHEEKLQAVLCSAPQLVEREAMKTTEANPAVVGSAPWYREHHGYTVVRVLVAAWGVVWVMDVVDFSRDHLCTA